MVESSARARPAHPPTRNAWPLWLSEFIGTALLVGAGCSVVILDFGTASPVAALLPDPGLRRALTGLLFGTIGALIAISPVGVVSGAHLNPVVTFLFRIEGRMKGSVAAGYVLAQLAGGAVGASLLLLWGARGASVEYAATLPGDGGLWAALLGEAAATGCLVAGLLLFVGHSRLRRFTPALFPPLYALLVWLEAPLSGTSTNPARSLGPGLVAGDLRGAWIYWLGPLVGALAVLALRRALPIARSLEVRVAKVFHFERDRHGFFGAMAAANHAADPGSMKHER